MVRVTKTYKKILNNKEIRMPCGIFLPGFLISPPTAASFVTPMYETKTRAAVDEKLCQSAPNASRDKAASQFNSVVANAQIQTQIR